MPEQTFSEDFYVPTLDAFRSMKSKWRVSIASMLHHSVELGLIGKEEGERLWINLGRRKWRTREPLDDDLQPEQPKVLERALRLLTDKQVLTIEDISHTFGFSESDVESLAGLPLEASREPTVSWSCSRSRTQRTSFRIPMPNQNLAVPTRSVFRGAEAEPVAADEA